MPRNLVVCCDGTANEFAADRTNVAKLCFAAVKDAERQLVYYHPGIGTMAPPGFVTGIGAKIAEIAGLAFGYGLKNDIADAYCFIMNHYRPGDRLFLFGFSRGAYTARVVAALIHRYGLIMPGNEGLVSYMVRMMWAINGVRNDPVKKTLYFLLADDFKATMAGVECKPHFVGVWDTVSSVGWVGSPVSLPDTKTNADIAIIRHAVSIDEHRAFFRTNLFEPAVGQNIRQVWFPGVHSDVGGGYPEAESGLSKIALNWMMEEAGKAGMLIDPNRSADILGGDTRYAKPDPKAKLHDSLTWPWWPAEYVPKRHYDRTTREVEWRINNFRRRLFTAAPVIHDAAWEISPDYAGKLPGDAIKLSDYEAMLTGSGPCDI